MKRQIVVLIIGLLGGGIAGFGLGIFIYPFWFLTDVASETLTPGIVRTAVADGAFIHVTPSDPVHWGTGGVTVYDEGASHASVFLHEDFEVGPGPRFHVYLVDHADVRGRNDFFGAEKVDLGRLRAFKGSQVYALPAGLNAGKFKSVVIWCKEFDVLISPASLIRPMASQPTISNKIS